MKKEEILYKLKELKPLYQKEGLEIVGLFGSYANDTQTAFSDVDIAYRLDYEKMAKMQKNDPFLVLLRIDEMKSELQKKLKKSVDLVPYKNKKILKGMIHV